VWGCKTSTPCRWGIKARRQRGSGQGDRAVELWNYGAAGRSDQVHAVLGPNHARDGVASSQALKARAFGPKARSPDPITLPYAAGTCRLYKKTGCSPCAICANSYQIHIIHNIKAAGTTQLDHSSRLADSLKALFAQCNLAFAFLPSKQCSGVVIGSGDRALGCKACVCRPWRADSRIRA
jgi:hypothetical protein